MNFIGKIINGFYLYLVDKFYKSRNLNFDILFSFLILQIITSVFIVSYTYDSNSHIIMGFSKRLMDDASAHEITEITDGFDDVTRSTEVGSYLIRDTSKVNINNKDLVMFMMGHLKQLKLVDSVYIGTESGYFIQLHKLSNESTYRIGTTKSLPKKVSFALRVVDRTTSQAVEVWYYLDESGNKLDQEEIPESQITYIAKNRPWYQKSSQMLANTWVGPFISDVSATATVACSVPFFSEHGALVGVISSSIALRNLSQAFATPGSISMLVNQKGEVIAHPTEKNIYSNLNGEPKLITVSNLDDKTAYEAFRIRTQQEEKERFVFNTSDGVEYIALFKSLKNENFSDWDYLMVTPMDVFIGEVKATQENTLIICLIMLVLSIITVIFIARRMSAPIHNLSDQADMITNFDLSPVDGVQSGIKEIQKLQNSISRMRNSLISFAKFVPENLVKKLLEKDTGVKVGGANRQLTIFHSDIVGFTAISESYPSEKLVVFLSDYFEEMTKILNANNGTIDKYVGDSIKAFWGAPNHDNEHVLHCCTGALLCQRRLQDLNRKWSYEKKPQFITRIGIHSGDVIVGNIGSSERLNYTVIGDSVSLSERLGAANRQYGTKIIVSESTVKQLQEHAVVRPLDILEIKGRGEVIQIYELVALKNSDHLVLPSNDQIKLCEEFTRGFRYYQEKRWDEAITLFKGLLLAFGRDKPCEILIERCEEFKKAPPDATWNGVYVNNFLNYK